MSRKESRQSGARRLTLSKGDARADRALKVTKYSGKSQARDQSMRRNSQDSERTALLATVND